MVRAREEGLTKLSGTILNSEAGPEGVEYMEVRNNPSLSANNQMQGLPYRFNFSATKSASLSPLPERLMSIVLSGPRSLAIFIA